MRKPTFLGPLIGKHAGEVALVNAEDGSILASVVEPAFDSKTRKRGLLGRESIPDDYALIIAPCNAVHTFFMQTPIDLVYVTRDGTVTKTRRSVRPWRVSGNLRAFAVIEAGPGFIDRNELVQGETVALREREDTGHAAAEADPVLPAHTPHSLLPKLRHIPSQRPVTLADVVGHKVPVSWVEAVAVVQELCAVVLARGPAADPRVPELQNIALTSAGGVSLLADGPAHHSPVQRLSLVLLSLTPEDQLPMPLRVLVLDEVSPRPRLASLRDLHRELKFFERPDRRAIVSGVRERLQHQLDPTHVRTLVPPSLLEPPPARKPYGWWKWRSVRVAVSMAILLLAVAAGVWVWMRPEGQWIRAGAAGASHTAAVMSQRVTQTANEQWRAAQWTLGLKPREPAPDVAPRGVVPGQTAGSNQAIPEEGEVPPPALPAVHLPRPPLTWRSDESPEGMAGPTLSTPSVPSSGSEIYSGENPKVVPPTRVSLGLPDNLGPWVALENRPEVEVVVSPTGEVESVRLLSGRPGPQTAMLLSAVKTWIFQPATLDGRAVRYRHRMRLPG